MKPKKRKKRNPGWFRKGHDPRRHELTWAERSLGYRHALEGLTPKCRWRLREKVARQYAAKRRQNLNGKKIPNIPRPEEQWADVPW